MKKTPKYAQIEAELIAQIESGQLAPGAELPSESDLIECYGVSRVTVRRAIDELYHQGYVEKMQGKRACVKEKVKLQELTSISSYTEEIIVIRTSCLYEGRGRTTRIKKSRSGFFYGANLFCGRIAIMSDEHSVALSIIQRD